MRGLVQRWLCRHYFHSWHQTSDDPPTWRCAACPEVFITYHQI